MSIWDEAESEARRLLELTWGTPGEEGFVLPVDPIRIARHVGIVVYTLKLEEDLGGVLAKEPGEDPTIVLNAWDSTHRQRFTCAHELGHFTRRTNQMPYDPLAWSAEDYEYVDRRSSLSSSGKDSEEMYANRFAAALLMPTEEVLKHYKKGMGPIELALIFKVSPEAMQIRCQTLDLLVD